MNKIRFVVGGNPELGGNSMRMMALSESDSIIQLDCSNELIMPSAFAYDKATGILYATDELNDGMGKLAAFEILESEFHLLQVVSTEGSNPCHVSLDYARNLIYVSHYSGGGVKCYKILSDGLIDENPLFVLQESKSFHCVLPLPDGFIALDSVDDELIHATYTSTMFDFCSVSVKIPSPRQAKIYDTNEVLVVCEEKSMIFIYDLVSKKVIPQHHTCIESNNQNKAATIWISRCKDVILVSNRGEDSLVAFDVRKSEYTILSNPRALIRGDGRCPRDFDIDRDERYAVVGFSESNCVTVYRISENKSKADCVASIKLIAPIGMLIL